MLAEKFSEASVTKETKSAETTNTTDETDDNTKTERTEYSDGITKEITVYYKMAVDTLGKEAFDDVQFIKFDLCGNLEKIEKVLIDSIKKMDPDYVISTRLITLGKISEVIFEIRYAEDYERCVEIINHLKERDGLKDC